MASTRAKNNRKRPASLKHGRPPAAKKASMAMSAQTTRKIIRGHHQLNKQIATAQAAGDEAQVADLRQQLERRGGLARYQAASMQGQSAERGGDSSVVLVGWLRSLLLLRRLPLEQSTSGAQPTLRLLEVGALSTKNACSTSGLFGEIARIDLNAQAKGIERQDFMRRPLPPAAPAAANGEHDEADDDGDDDTGRFDVLSLSLVLNFVPDAPGRGEMLRRTTAFLRRGSSHKASKTTTTTTSPSPSSDDGDNIWPLPALFLVLPRPCLTHSRYCDEERLTLLMASLGYVLLRHRQTAKLVYTLWQWRDRPARRQGQRFGKVQVREGARLNNFRIELA